MKVIYLDAAGINQAIQDSKNASYNKNETADHRPFNAGQISDGYHTFDELYDHRIQLYISLCRLVSISSDFVWRSKAHSNGIEWDGWFILGVGYKPGEQMTYHLPLSKWEECSFANDLEKAPEWDGHTSADVLERLKSFF